MDAVNVMPAIVDGKSHAFKNRHDLSRPYKCQLCDKAFHRLEHQTRHIRVHTGEKPYACQFHGCTRRFSRSDELTRHSRIHNPRRSNKAKHTVVHTFQNVIEGPCLPAMATMISLPTTTNIFRSAPTPATGLQNISLPHPFASHSSTIPSNLNLYGRKSEGSSNKLPQSLQINLLPNTATEVEQESTPVLHHLYLGSSRYRPYYNNSNYTSRSHLLSLSGCTMSRLHSPNKEEHRGPQQHREPSQPNSPQSAFISSPVCSQDSPLTPEHTRQLHLHTTPYKRGYNLPGIRYLSVQTTPAFAPMELGKIDGKYCTAAQQPPNTTLRAGLTTRDSISRTDRTLPVPQVRKVAVQDLLSPEVDSIVVQHGTELK